MSDRTADRVEIADLIVRYAFHFDAREGDEFAALFTPDATFVRPDGITVTGAADLKAMADGAPAMQHFPTPAAIDFEGEDVARARSRVIALRADSTALHMVTAGEYVDELHRTEAGWRIHERRILAWLPAELSNVRLAGVE
jgi:ketosteroid isomerase-like protein